MAKRSLSVYGGALDRLLRAGTITPEDNCGDGSAPAAAGCVPRRRRSRAMPTGSTLSSSSGRNRRAPTSGQSEGVLEASVQDPDRTRPPQWTRSSTVSPASLRNDGVSYWSTRGSRLQQRLGEDAGLRNAEIHGWRPLLARVQAAQRRRASRHPLAPRQVRPARSTSTLRWRPERARPTSTSRRSWSCTSATAGRSTSSLSRARDP